MTPFRATTVGHRLGDIEALIAAASVADGPAVDLADGKVSIGTAAAPVGGTDVWLVRYETGIIEVPVERGENRGRTLPHAHVVRELTRLGAWTGSATTYTLPPASQHLATAVLVQARDGGPILTAASD